jgi:hypothetical protein
VDKKHFLRIDWNRNTQGSGQINYTNILTGADEIDSYIKAKYIPVYANDFFPSLNRHYTVFGPKNNHQTDIHWNFPKKMVA